MVKSNPANAVSSDCKLSAGTDGISGSKPDTLDAIVFIFDSAADFNADADVKLPPSCDVKEFFSSDDASVIASKFKFAPHKEIHFS